MPSPIKILRVESVNVIAMEPKGWRMTAKSKCERFVGRIPEGMIPKCNGVASRPGRSWTRHFQFHEKSGTVNKNAPTVTQSIRRVPCIRANASKCSAELNSAVSPICNRLAVAEHGAMTMFAPPQNAVLRYSRLQICATNRAAFARIKYVYSAVRIALLIRIVLILCAVDSSVQAQDAAPAPVTVFSNVRIFDGKSGQLFPPSNVLVRGNTIEKISTDPISVDRRADTTLI